MLWAAGEEAPKRVFSHGFVTVDGTKMGKSMGNVVQPLDIIAKSSVDAYRYFFMRECPFPGDGDYSGQRFEEVYNSELANNLGNMYSRCVTLISKNYDGVLDGTAEQVPLLLISSIELERFCETEGIGEGYGVGAWPVEENDQFKDELPNLVRLRIEDCRYNWALQAIIQILLTPTNQYLETHAPWKLVKTDKEAAKKVLLNAVQSLRIASILLKPFIPRSAETIYTSFNFPTPWADVKYADAAELRAQPDDLRVTAELVDGKVKPLFPRIA
jgi:methionyl-tRNA synthetase